MISSKEWYARGKAPLTEIFLTLSKEIKKELSKVRKQEITNIELALNYEYDLASHYIWMFSNPHIAELPRRKQILFSAFHKNLFAFYSSLRLTEDGFYGAARSMLRHIYESLMVAKFCSITNDDKLYTSWAGGNPVYFTNGVLKRIKKPDTEEFRFFWNGMCNFSHSTIYAQQVDLDWESSKQQIFLNLVLLQILLECNYHLLSRHLITSSMQYYADRYTGKRRIRELKNNLYELFKRTKKPMSKAAKRLISDYKKSWIIK